MQPLIDVIRNAQAADMQAVEDLLSHYSRVVRQECDRYGLSGQADMSGSDLSQEVLLQVWLRLHQFRGSESEEHTVRAFECWLRLTARSVIINLHRSRNAQKRKPSEDILTLDENNLGGAHPIESTSTPSSIYIKQEEVERMAAVFAQHLNSVEREIVTRYVLLGETYRQIADAMSLDYDEVRRIFRTACAKLAKWLL